MVRWDSKVYLISTCFLGLGKADAFHFNQQSKKKNQTTFKKLASILKGKEASSAGPRISTWCRPGCSVRRDTTNVSSEPTPAISPACPWAGGPTAFTSGRKRVKIFLLNFECTVLNAPLWRRMDRLWCGEECSTDSCQCTKVFSFTTAQPNWRWNDVNPTALFFKGIRSMFPL